MIEIDNNVTRITETVKRAKETIAVKDIIHAKYSKENIKLVVLIMFNVKKRRQIIYCKTFFHTNRIFI